MKFVTTLHDENQIEIAFTGRLDTTGVGEIDAQLYTLLNSVQTPIYFDFEGVTYLSSMGIRLIISSSRIAKKTGHPLFIINANPDIHHILEMTKLDNLTL